jgi:hypothetical protein
MMLGHMHGRQRLVLACCAAYANPAPGECSVARCSLACTASGSCVGKDTSLIISSISASLMFSPTSSITRFRSAKKILPCGKTKIHLCKHGNRPEAKGHFVRHMQAGEEFASRARGLGARPLFSMPCKAFMIGGSKPRPIRVAACCKMLHSRRRRAHRTVC